MSGDPDENLILRKGYIKVFQQKKMKFEERYFVLYNGTSKNAARLDWFKTETDFENNHPERNSLFIEEILKVSFQPYDSKMEQMYGKNPSAKFLMSIATYRKDKIYRMMFESNPECTEWERKLNDLTKQVRERSMKLKKTPIDRKDDEDYIPKMSPSETFDVEIDDTAAAIRCNLHGQNYKLALSDQHLTLMSSSGDVAITWQYKFVRRFGYSETTFTIEGGKRSGSGEGLFILKNCSGKDIMDRVNRRMKSIAISDSETYCEVKSPPIGGDGYYIVNADNKTNYPVTPNLIQTPIATSGVKVRTQGVNNTDVTDSSRKKAPEPAQKKPSLAKKPSDNVDKNINHEINEADDDYEMPVEGSKQASVKNKITPPSKSENLKMSDVLKARAEQQKKSPPNKFESFEANVYDHLDLKMESDKRKSDLGPMENLYGQQLIQHQKERDIKIEGDYSEIVVNKKK